MTYGEEGCLQILYIFVLRAGKKTTFDGKVVETVARNANIYFAGHRYTVII